MKIGYIRVSSTGQNIDSQKLELEKYGVDNFFIDRGKTGRNTNREQYQQMLEFCKKKDQVICYDFSIISRSLKDLLITIDLLTTKDVSLISIKEGFDSGSSAGKFFIQILGTVNEYQINLQREKILDGIEEAKKKGIYKGRKKISIDNFEEYYIKYKIREIKTKTELAKIIGISRQTLYSLISEYEKTTTA